ncbi:hypothetical protein NLG97_g5289 [Lecanicillium saksenae]|uniref:Uncharacterized protein n=1 Tax=Lecanicillium saksenae TaxID=468837 RepID=A0ACC1QSU0_9HYPO|nr:hypothetical protein NLG97_g5289 [Lecanicillium saksenae]
MMPSGRGTCRKTEGEVVLRQRLLVEAEPPDWDFTQAARYYYTVIKAISAVDNPPFHHPGFFKCRFICQMLCDQLCKGSRIKNKVLGPGEDPEFAGIWTKFYRYSAECLAIINRSMHEKGTARLTGLTGIIYLVFNDMCMNTSRWQAHIKGYLAYLEHLGGIARVLKMSSAPLYGLHIISVMGTVLNTTTPANQQVNGFDNFSDEHFKTTLGFTFEAGLPCPVDFQIAIVHINRMRAACAKFAMRPTPESQAAMARKVSEMFEKLQDADLDEWSQGVDWTHDKEKLKLAARIFLVAVRLYGILTLPSPVVMPWVASSAQAQSKIPGMSAYETVRLQHHQELMALLREDWETIEYQGSIAWPLIVAGVASAKGPAEDCGFIDHCLGTIWRKPSAAATFLLALQKLRDFWRSGKTGWEDCFDEPTPCYP